MRYSWIFFFSLAISLLGASCHQTAVLRNDGGLLPSGNQRLYLEMPTSDEEARVGSPMPVSPRKETAMGVYYTPEKQEYLATAMLPDTVTQSDTTEVEPVLQPLIVAGTAATGAAVVTGVVVALGPLNLFFIPLLLLAGGATLVTIGYKKLKIEPEKYKGTKLAMISYYTMVGIGAVLMLLPVYWLFNL